MSLSGVSVIDCHWKSDKWGDWAGAGGQPGQPWAEVNTKLVWKRMKRPHEMRRPHSNYCPWHQTCLCCCCPAHGCPHGHQGSALLCPWMCSGQGWRTWQWGHQCSGSVVCPPRCSQMHRVCNGWARDRGWGTPAWCAQLCLLLPTTAHTNEIVRASALWILLHKALPVAASCHTTHMQTERWLLTHQQVYK